MCDWKKATHNNQQECDKVERANKFHLVIPKEQGEDVGEALQNKHPHSRCLKERGYFSAAGILKGFEKQEVRAEMERPADGKFQDNVS